MRLIKSTIHPEINVNAGRQFTRLATRAIVIKGEEILLLYTERYHDYSLPGGGVDDGESLLEGLKRELREEAGAQHVQNIQPFGIYEEYRPWYKDDFDIMHMKSYCYVCEIDDVLLSPQLELYEQRNGMKPVWINIHQAIAHNETILAKSAHKGLSIERETYLLRLVIDELLYAESGYSNDNIL